MSDEYNNVNDNQPMLISEKLERVRISVGERHDKIQELNIIKDQRIQELRELKSKEAPDNEYLLKIQLSIAQIKFKLSLYNEEININENKYEINMKEMILLNVEFNKCKAKFDDIVNKVSIEEKRLDNHFKETMDEYQSQYEIYLMGGEDLLSIHNQLNFLNIEQKPNVILFMEKIVQAIQIQRRESSEKLVLMEEEYYKLSSLNNK
jgi:hypothetical protein